MSASSSVDDPPGKPEAGNAIAAALLEAAVAPVRGVLHYAGEHAILLGNAMAGVFRKPFRLRLYLEQAQFVGVGSLPIICLVGFFS
ncbi:MAG: hypothetical protein ABUS79_11245, partial [Pseudomonadota bacterium]